MTLVEKTQAHTAVALVTCCYWLRIQIGLVGIDSPDGFYLCKEERKVYEVSFQISHACIQCVLRILPRLWSYFSSQLHADVNNITTGCGVPNSTFTTHFIYTVPSSEGIVEERCWQNLKKCILPGIIAIIVFYSFQLFLN